MGNDTRAESSRRWQCYHNKPSTTINTFLYSITRELSIRTGDAEEIPQNTETQEVIILELHTKLQHL